MPRVSKRRRATVVLQIRVPVDLRDEIASIAHADLVSMSTAARQILARGVERERTVTPVQPTAITKAAA